MDTMKNGELVGKIDRLLQRSLLYLSSLLAVMMKLWQCRQIII
jgi:hypothetical protein